MPPLEGLIEIGLIHVAVLVGLDRDLCENKCIEAELLGNIAIEEAISGLLGAGGVFMGGGEEPGGGAMGGTHPHRT